VVDFFFFFDFLDFFFLAAVVVEAGSDVVEVAGEGAELGDGTSLTETSPLLGVEGASSSVPLPTPVSAALADFEDFFEAAEVVDDDSDVVLVDVLELVVEGGADAGALVVDAVEDELLADEDVVVPAAAAAVPALAPVAVELAADEVVDVLDVEPAAAPAALVVVVVVGELEVDEPEAVPPLVEAAVVEPEAEPED